MIWMSNIDIEKNSTFPAKDDVLAEYKQQTPLYIVGMRNSSLFIVKHI